MLLKTKRNKTFIHGDFDNDGIANIDDKYPFNNRKHGQVEETSLGNELKIIRNRANKFTGGTKKIAKQLKHKGFSVRYRIKGTNSIINKIRRKSLNELTDIGGILLLVNNEKEALMAGKYIEKNYKVIDKDDYFANPKDEFYRAIHYVVKIQDLPFEIQVKTKKEYKIHLKAHQKYKSGTLNKAYNLRLLDEAMT